MSKQLYSNQMDTHAAWHSLSVLDFVTTKANPRKKPCQRIIMICGDLNIEKSISDAERCQKTVKGIPTIINGNSNSESNFLRSLISSVAEKNKEFNKIASLTTQKKTFYFLPVLYLYLNFCHFCMDKITEVLKHAVFDKTFFSDDKSRLFFLFENFWWEFYASMDFVSLAVNWINGKMTNSHLFRHAHFWSRSRIVLATHNHLLRRLCHFQNPSKYSTLVCLT